MFEQGSHGESAESSHAHTRAAASATVPRDADGEAAGAMGWWTVRRRSYLVHGPHQIRAVLWVAGLSTLFLAALDLTLYKLQQARSEQMIAIAPELTRLFAEQDKGLMTTVYLGSFVALLAVVTVTLFETHRTAGPLFGLRLGLDRLGKEGPSVRVHFRKEDHYRELETSFNEAARALHERGQQRALEVHRISEDMRDIANRIMSPLPDVRVVSEALRQLAEKADSVEKDLRQG